MTFKPLDKMWERVENAREESDTAYFLSLLYLGEMVVKTVVSGLVAAVEEDKERHQYRQLWRLVRADSLGDWTQVLDEVLLGSSSQHLLAGAREEQKSLTEKVGGDAWQHQAVSHLRRCLKATGSPADRTASKADGRTWFPLFAELRNRTRAHGATLGQACSDICPDLKKSLSIFTRHFRLFARPWAYLHRELSGKFSVTKLTDDCSPFDPLKSATSFNLPDGVYVFLDKYVPVPLIHSTKDAIDFHFPNGNFNDKRFELLSYITDNRLDGDPCPYMLPPGDLPRSTTEGTNELDVLGEGEVWTNLPALQEGYVHRRGLEQELRQPLLETDKYPIVTLIGRGGIGKTCLALSVLRQLADTRRFAAIVWFSARDVDLLPDGPKPVRPHVVTEEDVATELARIAKPGLLQQKTAKRMEHFQDELTKSELGNTLFVFDNFETLHDPADTYAWVNTYVRLPNKVLITSRERGFKADYPVEVSGMEDSEFRELVDSTAHALGITHLLSDRYLDEVYHESGGHPYVAKILLGEVARSKKPATVERVMANEENILNALFERTYSRLSPAAQRVFLTLCGWRSVVPRVAIEAVILRSPDVRIDVGRAIEELRWCSFVEERESQKDGSLFLSVPLAARLFGKSKLPFSPLEPAVESDCELLREFGPAQESDVRGGLGPRVERLFRTIADGTGRGQVSLEDRIPTLEYVAHQHPPAWLKLATLYEESGHDLGLAKAKEAVRSYLQTHPDESGQVNAWDRLANLCRRSNDPQGELHALAQMSSLTGTPFAAISNAANRVNALLKQHHSLIGTDEKRKIIDKVINAMESRLAEADANDCSRLAWLYLRVKDEDTARRAVEVGLERDPDNWHCLNLKTKLSYGEADFF